MTAYLDSSVILRRLLGQPDALEDWDEECVTSELARVESLRVLDRLRLQGSLDDDEMSEKMRGLREILERTHVLSLDKMILNRASQALPVVLGALDAIHLASALRYSEWKKERMMFLTHDRRLATAASAFGFDARGAD